MAFRNWQTFAMVLVGAAGVLAQTAKAPLVTPVAKTAKIYADLKAADAGASMAGVAVDKAANRITISGPRARINVHAGPESNMMSYEILGLSNPELRVASGSELTLNVVNVDDDMNHNLVISRSTPPFAADPVLGPDAVSSGMIKPHEDKQPISGVVLVVKAGAAGSGYYLCTAHGHAKQGMYGKFTVY